MSDRWPERDWFEKADQDLELARRALGPGKWEHISFTISWISVIFLRIDFPTRNPEEHRFSAITV